MGRFRSPRRLVAFVAAVGLLAGSAPAIVAQGPSTDGFSAAAVQPVQAGGTIVGDLAKAARTRDGRIAVIVRLKDASVASYRGGVKGFAATSPRALGTSRLDVKSRATVDYRRYLRGKQDSFVRGLAAKVPSRVTGRFDLVLDARVRRRARAD